MKKSIFVSTLVAAAALATPAFADTLTWGGNSGDSWTTEGVWSSGNWVAGSDALFTSTGAGTVNVTTGVTAGTVTIQDTGYTFVIGSDATLTVGSVTGDNALTITGSGTFVLDGGESGAYNVESKVSAGEDFTGNIQVTKGHLTVGGTVGSSSTTVTITAVEATKTGGGYYSGSDVNAILLSSTSTTFAANLVLDGKGGVMLRTGGNTNTITFTGSVTGANAEIQLNGAGAAIFQGAVNLGGYINYQGTTTFENSVTLDTLDILQDGNNSSAVIFSGESAQATVGTLSVDTSSGQGTDSLQVVSGASLTVGTISLAHDINVTTDSSSTFTVTGNVTSSGGNLILGSGSTLTATGETGTTIQGIAGAGTLEIKSSATGTQFTVVTDDSFTGTVNVVEGQLLMSSSSIADTAKLVLQASGSTTNIGIYTDTDGALVSLHYGEDGATLAHDITVSGEGGVIIRSYNSAWTGTFSGDITGDDASYLQLNGGGSAIFTGDVTLENGGYINYQGSTTFKDNTVILGSLAIYQPSGETNAVTFTGEEAAAEIGTLTIHSSEGTDAINLAVTADAAVQVGILEISHDIAITLDSGMLWVTDSVTQTASTSTTVTISNGGTLFLGDEVTLNAATISIVLSTENLEGEETYALFGTGSITSDVAIAVTVDSAVEQLLADGGEYTFSVYDTNLGLADSNFTADEIIAAGYDVTWNNDGTITIAVGAIPEPSMFGLMFGLGAIGLVATRRRRR